MYTRVNMTQRMTGRMVIFLMVASVLILTGFIPLFQSISAEAAQQKSLYGPVAVRECQFVSNGDLLITTTAGTLFTVNGNKVAVAPPDSRLDGTYVDFDLGSPPTYVSPRPTPYSALNATIHVRTEKDHAAWQDTLKKIVAKFYAPRDVPPPPLPLLP